MSHAAAFCGFVSSRCSLRSVSIPGLGIFWRTNCDIHEWLTSAAAASCFHSPRFASSRLRT